MIIRTILVLLFVGMMSQSNSAEIYTYGCFRSDTELMRVHPEIDAIKHVKGTVDQRRPLTALSVPSTGMIVYDNGRTTPFYIRACSAPDTSAACKTDPLNCKAEYMLGKPPQVPKP